MLYRLAGAKRHFVGNHTRLTFNFNSLVKNLRFQGGFNDCGPQRVQTRMVRLNFCFDKLRIFGFFLHSNEQSRQSANPLTIK